MATQFEIDCALMAGRAYYDKRAEINRFPVPAGWLEIPLSHVALPGGFEAVSFQSGSQIVISFTGTDQLSDWTSANVPLAFGLPSDQLYQAAQYYLEVKAANLPGTVISFTGHSLGGGLAALMGVLFDENAITFDQAPFASAAKITIRDDLVSYLTGHGYTTATLSALAPELFSYDGSAARAANVDGYYVQGEAMQLLPFSILGSQTMLSQTSTGLGTLGSVSLHSIALLNAFLENNGFELVTSKLPDLLAMLFDSNLFAYPTDKNNDKNVNLLERLVQHEAGVRDPVTGATTLAVDQMLDRFTEDLWKLAQDGGLTLHDNNPSNPDLNEVGKALTAFAMQFYYQDTANALNATKELFSTDGLTGGIQFDIKDVADTLADAKGYNLYFRNYLKQGEVILNGEVFTPGIFSTAEQQLIQSLLPQLRDWFVQAGAGGMTTADTLNRGAFMLGGSSSDTLTGGDKADLLVGNAGNDTLKGGANNDTLIGGAGFDTYVVNVGDGFDTVLDSDGSGVVKFGTIEAQGSNGLDPTKWLQLGTDIWSDQVNGITYTKSVVDGETQLLIHKGDSNMLVKGWSDGELGIVLGAGSTLPDPATVLTGTALGNYLEAASGGQRVEGLAGADMIHGSAGIDHLLGGDGGDWIVGNGGADHIEGGLGNDYISGIGANSLVGGGDGNDILSAYGSDWIIIQTPNSPISADVFWADAASVLFNPGSNVYTDSNNAPTFEYGAFPVNASYSGTSSLGGGWTYQFTVANGVWDAKYFHPQTAPDGIKPAAYWEQRIQGQLLTEGVFLQGGAGDDLLISNNGSDVLDGGPGQDNLFGIDGDDILDGGAEADILAGGNGADVLIGGAGTDTLFGEAGDDILLSGSEDDALVGGAGDDILDGGAGADILQGGAGNDTYLNVTGQDSLFDIEGDNLIQLATATGIGAGGLAASATPTNGLSVDIALDSGDTLKLDSAFYGMSATITFANGDAIDLETLVGETLATPLDLINDDSGGRVYGGAGNDLLTGGAGADTLAGHNGNDVLQGGDGNDILDGGAGNDSLVGGDGDDIFQGGAGRDTLQGNAGLDIYQFDLGGGSDIVIAQTPADASADVLQLGQGLAQADVEFVKFADGGLLVRIISTQDSLKFEGWFTNGAGVSVVRFADNSELTSAAISALAVEGFGGTTLDDYIVGTAVSDRILGYGGNDTLDGGAGDDELLGGNGDDWLIGGTGNDIAYGGQGNDTYRLTKNFYGETTYREVDQVVEYANEGIDTLLTIWGGTLPDNVENMNLNDGSGSYATFSVSAIGNSLDNILIGRSAGVIGQDVLDGKAGADTMYASNGWQLVYVDNPGDRVIGQAYEIRSSIDYALLEPSGSWVPGFTNGMTNRLALIGSAAVNGTGNVLNNVLFGNLNTATNTLTGGLGDDIFIIGLNDSVVEAVGEGSDSAYVSLTAADFGREIRISDLGFNNIENYGLAGNADNVTLHGDAGDNELRVELSPFSSYRANLRGEGGNDRLIGGATGEVLDGGTGTDYMAGGSGNDVYIVDSAGDQVAENLSNYYNSANSWDYQPTFGWFSRDGGIDIVQSSITYSLGANVENLTLTGTIAIDGTGNELTNVLRGNSASNTLSGLDGNDTIYAGNGDHARGGNGNDTLISENTGTWSYLWGEAGDDVLTGGSFSGMFAGGLGNDIITGGSGMNFIWGDDQEVAGGGNDTITGGNDYDYIVAGEGDDVVYGNEGNDNLSGNAGNDMLYGGAGNDYLIGGGGIDTLVGSIGDDIYSVNDVSDLVTENAGEGTDTVQSTITRTLAANVENLTLTGTATINGTGNELANVLRGNSASNTLSGLDGDDTIYAGGGDGVYGGEGNDTLILENTNSWTALFGEGGNDVLIGGSSSGLLVGGTGSDTITGSLGMNFIWGDDQIANGLGGNDIITGGNDYDYVVAGEGDDVVYGNGGGDYLVGNQGNDTLYGGAGNDTLMDGPGDDFLDGGLGADSLNGGAGDDTYILGRGYGIDTVVENDTSAGNTDIAQFLTGVSADQIWFKQATNNLEVSIIGTSDKLVINDWYLGDANHVEQFKTTDGARTLLDSNVQNLVNAMASFAPPAAGQTTLPTNYQDALAGVIAANWQ